MAREKKKVEDYINVLLNLKYNQYSCTETCVNCSLMENTVLLDQTRTPSSWTLLCFNDKLQIPYRKNRKIIAVSQIVKVLSSQIAFHLSISVAETCHRINCLKRLWSDRKPHVAHQLKLIYTQLYSESNENLYRVVYLIA